jgi:hypothetical protein
VSRRDIERQARKRALVFRKKEAKNVFSRGAMSMQLPPPAEAKVFCFFFSKKKRLLAYPR